MRNDRFLNLPNKKCFPFLLVLGVLALPILWACGSSISVSPLVPEEIPRIEAAGNYPHHVYRIEPGDTIRIRYPFHPEMNQGGGQDRSKGVIVRPDGKITANLVGEIIVAGMTTAAVEKLLVERTSDRLRNPEVVVSISEFKPRNVYVGGEVGTPATVPYRKGLTPLQAIIAAGGFLDTAQTDSVILVRTGGTDKDFISRKLNLTEAIASGVKEPIYLAPHDIVYVPRTAIADANLWVKQYIVDLIPFVKGSGPASIVGAVAP